jgi:hypothetical protein
MNNKRKMKKKKKNSSLKRAGGVAQGVGPEFKHQYCTHTHTYTQNHLCLSWTISTPNLESALSPRSSGPF